jgi:heme-degrading monooxygenase HmoA
MIITVTSIKLRSLFSFFKLSLFALRIIRQLETQPGFRGMKKTGLGSLHYTMSAWDSEADMQRFSKSGAHLEAMRQSRSIGSEIQTYTYEADSFPSWKEAKLLLEKGKRIVLERA